MLVVGAASLIFLPGFSAQATACPNLAIDFQDEVWAPGANVNAFRAPLVFRKNGSVCSPEGTSSIWIAIQASAGTQNGGISQRGWIHASGLGYCRFWEWNDNLGNPDSDSGVQVQHCGDDADGAVRDLKVAKAYIQAEHIYTYAIYDCGTSGWSTCTLEDAGPDSSNFGNSWGAAAAEVHYGGVLCTDDMLGSQNQQVKWGGADPIQGIKELGGVWDVRPLTYQDRSICGQFVSPTHTDSQFNVYDSNT